MLTECEIIRLGVRGDGIAEGPIYAPRTLPGERVRGELDHQQLTGIKIDRPSPDRVTPGCRHYNACGGCQLQHCSDEYVANWKTSTIVSALAAHGLETEIRPIATSPARSRRRAGFAVRRTKKGVLVGFHAQASETITAVPDCQLVTPGLKGALPVAEDLARIAASRKAELTVALTETETGLDLSVQGGKPQDQALWQELSDLAARHDLARLEYGGDVIVTRRAPLQKFEDIEVSPPAGAFLQATKEAELCLQRDVISILDGATHVADLFSGCGTFALPLSKRSSVHAVEGDQAMLDCLSRAWRKAQGVKALTSERRDLFRNPILAKDLTCFDGVVIDPPRAGAQAQTAELAQSHVPRIAYVSCNPISFARDAKALVEAGYHLRWIRPVDQFRWSAHVELVALFEL